MKNPSFLYFPCPRQANYLCTPLPGQWQWEEGTLLVDNQGLHWRGWGECSTQSGWFCMHKHMLPQGFLGWTLQDFPPPPHLGGPGTSLLLLVAVKGPSSLCLIAFVGKHSTGETAPCFPLGGCVENNRTLLLPVQPPTPVNLTAKAARPSRGKRAPHFPQSHLAAE